MERIVSGTFTIFPVIVKTHGNHIFTIFEIGGDVKSYSHHTVFMKTDVFTIDIEITTLTHALKFDEYFGNFGVGDFEMFAVPRDGICQLVNCDLERLILVEGMGESDTFPTTVVKRYTFAVFNITDGDEPVAVEIILLPFNSLCTYRKKYKR